MNISQSKQLCQKNNFKAHVGESKLLAKKKNTLMIMGRYFLNATKTQNRNHLISNHLFSSLKDNLFYK